MTTPPAPELTNPPVPEIALLIVIVEAELASTSKPPLSNVFAARPMVSAPAPVACKV